MSEVYRTKLYFYKSVFNDTTTIGNLDYSDEIYPTYLRMSNEEYLKYAPDSSPSRIVLATRNNNTWSYNLDRLNEIKEVFSINDLSPYFLMTPDAVRIDYYDAIRSGMELIFNKDKSTILLAELPGTNNAYAVQTGYGYERTGNMLFSNSRALIAGSASPPTIVFVNDHGWGSSIYDGNNWHDSEYIQNYDTAYVGVGTIGIAAICYFPVITEDRIYKFSIAVNNVQVWLNFSPYRTPFSNENFISFIKNSSPYSPEQPSDPFGDGGTSETGGGGGSFDFESADIPESPLPTLNATATGFTRVFNPSLTQLNALASYLWTTDSFWETVFNHTKQLLENPMQYMIALNMLPVAVPQGSSQSVKFLWIDTGVSMPPVTNQFVDVDCGTYTFNPIYGSALDYSPYTEIELFLPFIGLVQLDTDEVMGKTIQVKYRVDVFTGICVASILVNGSVLYQHQGTCAISIPFSGADFTRYVSAVTTIAKAGISVASASPNAILGSDTTSSNYNNHVYPVTIANAVTNSVAAVVGSKPTIEHTGSFGAVSGYLGTRYCWVNIKAPRMANPDKYGAYNGYPTMVTMNLSECSGFTKVQSIYLNGFGQATADELSELDELLKSGVYL